MTSSDLTQAILDLGPNYISGAPSPRAAETDRAICLVAICPDCKRLGMEYLPFWRRANGQPMSYRPFWACPECGCGGEF